MATASCLPLRWVVGAASASKYNISSIPMSDTGEVPAQAEGQGPAEEGLDTTNDKDRKKHSKKNKQPRPDGSPAPDASKRTKKNAKQAVDGGQDPTPAKSENDNQGEASEKKKKKKKAVVVTVENAEDNKDPADPLQAADSNKARKSTLLMCDNAAAVALGNLLAIQRGVSSKAEGQDEADEAQWLEDIEDEEVDQILAKAKVAEQRVAELRSAISEVAPKTLDGYFEELAKLTQDNAFAVGIADEDRVIAVEQKEAQENIESCVAQQKELQQQQQRLLLYEQVVRKRILDELEWREAKLKVLRRQAEKQDLKRQDHLVKLVRECECRMESLMGRRKACLSSVYGLLKKQGEYMAVSKRTDDTKSNERNNFIPMGKSYRVEWLRAPQPLKMQIDLCRALKDKVPDGRYVISVSIWTRIGGTRLRWNGLPSIEEELLRDATARKQSKVSLPLLSAVDNAPEENKAFAGATAAVTHSVEFRANFTDECLRFDQTLELACPSETDVEPDMCLVVGWGAFPLVDSDFRLIEGSFKVPLLRGSVDPSIRRYLDLEHLISNNLDSWLCHLYFRCQRLPQYTRGQVEFELQLEHAAALLADDLVRQLVSALHACEEMADQSSTIVSKDGVRAWRHKDEPSSFNSIPDVDALQDYGYSGVWLYLRSAKVPIHNVEFSAFYVRLDFVQELLSLGQTISVTVAGPLACLVAFVLASVTVHVANITLGRQPTPVYQFCSALGAATALNPILMAAIEGISSNMTGISFMLSNYYIRDVNNATLGVIIALLIDFAFIGCNTLAYYSYAIAVHRHGQVKDTHRRLTGDASLFHLPLDTEVSERHPDGTIVEVFAKLPEEQHPSDATVDRIQSTTEPNDTGLLPHQGDEAS
ncbi:hypothetical protein, conserved [Eimeria brunetti]|uniref:Uncharacterized protein n=1 Tax=Eimeria brunetti TaxID=51314 RepID=U6LGP9_9EIME|nr:hypothetical protein, conserved [Eimeria brunetti]